MIPDDLSFELFLRERLKDKNISLKKLADLTGISSNHIEGFLRGDLEAMPPTPYFRGYLIRLGEVLEFDGEGWWEKIKKEGLVKRSGPQDTLPRNRFVRKSPAKMIALFAIALFALIYVVFQLPRVLGRPVFLLSSPQDNPAVSNSNVAVLQGTAKNTDSLLVNGEEVIVASDGTWQKNVFLSNGPNQFEITAKKFLGGTVNFTEQITYNAPATTSSSSASTAPITVPTSTEASTSATTTTGKK
jgi:cytoskeletal protein RodZ